MKQIHFYAFHCNERQRHGVFFFLGLKKILMMSIWFLFGGMVAVVILNVIFVLWCFWCQFFPYVFANFCQLQHCWSNRYFASNASWCEVARRADAACVARPQICSFHRLGAPLYHTWVRLVPYLGAPLYHTWVRPCTILGCAPVSTILGCAPVP